MAKLRLYATFCPFFIMRVHNHNSALAACEGAILPPRGNS